MSSHIRSRCWHPQGVSLWSILLQIRHYRSSSSLFERLPSTLNLDRGLVKIFPLGRGWVPLFFVGDMPHSHPIIPNRTHPEALSPNHKPPKLLVHHRMQLKQGRMERNITLQPCPNPASLPPLCQCHWIRQNWCTKYEPTLGRYRQKYVDFPESSCLLFVAEVLHASLSLLLQKTLLYSYSMLCVNEWIKLCR